MQVIAYSQTEFIKKDIAAPDELQPLIGKYSVLWLNVDGLGDTEAIRKFGEIFSIHPLALEDVVDTTSGLKWSPTTHVSSSSCRCCSPPRNSIPNS